MLCAVLVTSCCHFRCLTWHRRHRRRRRRHRRHRRHRRRRHLIEFSRQNIRVIFLSSSVSSG